MTSSSPVLTRTDRNLWNAIVSEALAYLKYNAYAHKALEEGHPEVAQVFQEVAGAETIHGLNHLRVSGEIRSTVENLREVAVGESREFSTRYPRMVREAVAEGRREVAESFALAMEREQHHQEMFERVLGQLEAKLAGQQSMPIPSPGVAATPPFPTASLPETSPPEAGAQHVVPRRGQPGLETYVAAASEVDRERWRVAAFGRLREVVFGAQDGILSTVALVTSVAVAVDQQATVLVAGLAAALAGMISMATGAFLGSRAELDVRRAEIAREARELEENPAQELAELVVIFQREGKSFAEARRLSEDIAADKDLWLRTLVEKELGISPQETASPIKDAMAMGAAFLVASLIPIVPYFFLSGSFAIALSVVASLLGLFVLGLGKGRLVQKSPLGQGLEILGIGVVSAALGFVLGDIVPRLVA
jgi:VIT1/CCC1 family predicted Fe2+/Mn2+ transporter/rubrerythrin